MWGQSESKDLQLLLLGSCVSLLNGRTPHPLKGPWRIICNCEDSSEDNRETMAQHFPGHKHYIMYHGTTLANARRIKREGFVQSNDGMLGRGVYLSRSYDKAARYPLNNRTEPLAVLKLKVRVGKVKKIDRQGHEMQRTWHDHGYDTAWVPPNCGMVLSGLEEDCVYDPWRITVLEIMPNNQP